jgi:hypothetical protein
MLFSTGFCCSTVIENVKEMVLFFTFEASRIIVTFNYPLYCERKNCMLTLYSPMLFLCLVWIRYSHPHLLCVL